MLQHDAVCACTTISAAAIGSCDACSHHCDNNDGDTDKHDGDYHNDGNMPLILDYKKNDA